MPCRSMDVTAFLNTYPCLEELRGYEQGIRWQMAHPDLLTHEMHHAINNERVLREIDKYRNKLLKGKVAPAHSRMPRAYRYRMGAKPVRNSRIELVTLDLS